MTHRPGDVIYIWWESDLDYHHHSGLAVITATSRSKRSLTEEDAIEALRDQYDDGITTVSHHRWHTYTQKQADDECIPDEADVGSYGEEGWGQAWIDVAIPSFDCDTPGAK